MMSFINWAASTVKKLVELHIELLDMRIEEKRDEINRGRTSGAHVRRFRKAG